MVLPEANTEERVQELLPKLRTGDKLVFAELARGYIKLTLAIVSEYRFERHETDDVVSCGLLGLANGLRRVTEGALQGENHLTNFVCNWIRSDIQAYFGKKVKDKKKHSLDIIEKILKISFNDVRKISEEQRFLEKFLPVCFNSFGLLEINEILEKVVKTDLEKNIIKLRMEGYYDIEIAEKLGYSAVYILQVGRKIQKRFEALYD